VIDEAEWLCRSRRSMLARSSGGDKASGQRLAERRSLSGLDSTGHRGPVQGALLLPDGALLSWSVDGTLKVWDRETGECTGTLEGHDDHSRGTLPIPEGSLLSWSEDGTLDAFTVRLGTHRTFQRREAPIRGALVLPDGAVLAWSMDKALKVWDRVTGQCRWTLSGHRDAVDGARVLPNGAILSWSADGTLKIWNGATGKCQITLEGHRGSILGSLALSKGEVLSWSEDKTLKCGILKRGNAAGRWRGTETLFRAHYSSRTGKLSRGHVHGATTR